MIRSATSGIKLRGRAEPGYVATAMGIRTGAPLPAALVSSEVSVTDGTTATIGELLARGQGEAALLVFVRQFACAGCSLRMAELLLHLHVLLLTSVKVVIVGCGSAAQARDFSGRFALETRTLVVATDPTQTAQRAAGLLRSRWGALGATATWNLLRAIGRGHANAWGHGDFFQLGGTFLVDADGTVVVHHEERHLGATLPFATVVERALILAGKRRPDVNLP